MPRIMSIAVALLAAVTLLLVACEPEQKPQPAQTSAPIAVAQKVAAGADLATGQKTYEAACAACHATGVSGAPRLGDRAAWTARIAEGLPELLHAALHGEGAMPAKGGNPALTDAEVEAAVKYMLEQSR